MAGMLYELGDGEHGVAGAGSTTTPQLRRMAANAARLRLPYQLDFRLDSVLDPDGLHIISLVSNRSGESPFDYDSADDAFARCYAHLKFLGIPDPFEMTLDLRLRDYLSLDPVSGARSSVATHTEVPLRHMLPDDDTPLDPLGGGA